MKQILFFFLSLLVGNLTVSAQTTSLSGRIEDTSHRQKMVGATISLVDRRDSSLVSFLQADTSGNFIFTNLHNGRYRLSASYSGFHTLWKNISINNEPSVDLGVLYMRDNSILSEIIIASEAAPVSVNGDTLEFNAGSFITKPNAVVEDLLKKMPGIQVDKDGTIRVNGQVIKKVFVNGKEFFTGDPTLATRNLAADAVDKVQVFEKKSDQSEFTGFNDGNSQTAINLKLKKNKKNPAFGKGTAGLGTDGHYQDQFNVNRFKGDQQLSAIGMANNINKQGFTLLDVLNFTGEINKMMKGGGGARMVINNGSGPDFGVPVEGSGQAASGIATTIAGGLNFNDTWHKKTDINGSYFYNNVSVATDQVTNRQNILPAPYNYVEHSLSGKSTESNRLNLSFDHKLDSFNSVKITPSFTLQQNNYHTQSSYISTHTDGSLLNSGSSVNSSSANAYDLKNNFLFRHRFARKGRTFSINMDVQYNDSRSVGTQGSETKFYSNGINTIQDTLDQRNHIQSITKGYTTTATYTEPLSRRTLLEFNAVYASNNGERNKNIYDLDPANGKYDNINMGQSNSFQNKYTTTGGGFGFRNVGKKYSLSIASNVESTILTNKIADSSAGIRKQYVNLLPSLNLSYSFTKMKTLRLDYNTTTKAPATLQLQPVLDSSDRLNISVGNPLLQQEVAHNVSVQFFSANPTLQKNLMMFGNVTLTQHAIVNSDVVDNLGTRLTKPVNAEGVYNAFATIDGGFRIKKINTRITGGGNVLYTRNINYIDGNKNQIGTTSFSPRLSVNYSFKDKFDITAEARISFNTSSYSFTKALDNRYQQQRYSVEANASLPWDLNINSDIEYIGNTGRATGYNTSAYLFNAAVSKLIFKNKKGEIKFSANDILDQNIGVSRNTNQSYIEDVTYRTLRRYYLLSFTYSLLKSSNNGPKVMMRTM